MEAFTPKTPLLTRSAWAALGMAAFFLVVGCSGRSTTVAEGRSSRDATPQSKKEKNSGTTSGVDKDTADEPAPIAGAYLACFVPPPKATDTEIYAGCQVRGKDHKKLNLTASNLPRWSYVPPKSAEVHGISAVDLSQFKSNYYFHVAYKMVLPKDSVPTSGPSSMFGLPVAKTTRAGATAFFMNASPIFIPKNGTTISLAKTKGAKLLELPARAAPTSFGEFKVLQSSSQTAYQMPPALANSPAEAKFIVAAPEYVETAGAPVYVPPADSNVDVLAEDKPIEPTQETGEGDVGYDYISGNSGITPEEESPSSAFFEDSNFEDYSGPDEFTESY